MNASYRLQRGPELGFAQVVATIGRYRTYLPHEPEQSERVLEAGSPA